MVVIIDDEKVSKVFFFIILKYKIGRVKKMRAQKSSLHLRGSNIMRNIGKLSDGFGFSKICFWM